jgi:hypothetical protein
MKDILDQLSDLVKAHGVAPDQPGLVPAMMVRVPLAIAEIERLRAALAAERERCAKIADDEDGAFTWAGTDKGVTLRQQVGREIAAAIRKTI